MRRLDHPDLRGVAAAELKEAAVDLSAIDAWPTSGQLIRALVILLDLAAILSVLAGRGSLLRKLTWTVVIVVLPVVGMVLYFLCGRSTADA